MLLALVAGPLLAALIVVRRAPGSARATAAWCAALHLALTVVFVVFAANSLPVAGDAALSFEPIAVPGDPGLGKKQPTATTTWTLLPMGTSTPDTALHSTAMQFFLGVDGLNLPLVALTSFMTLMAILVSWESVGGRAGGFYCWLFLLQAACLGAFLSFDLLLFYVFFELTLIPAFFLIGSYGTGGGRRDAAKKFFLYTLFGSLFTLVGILGIAISNPTPVGPDGVRVKVVDKFLPATGAVTFSIPELMSNVRTWDDAYEAAVKRAKPDEVEAAVAAQKDRRRLAVWLFVALLAGFAVKVPIVPFHTWLPSAYAEAPLAVTLLLSAILAKFGTFGMLRIVLPLVA